MNVIGNLQSFFMFYRNIICFSTKSETWTTVIQTKQNKICQNEIKKFGQIVNKTVHENEV